MDAASTHRQGPEAPTAMVAEGSQELIITKKKKNSPHARELKTVDPMNDDGIWCVLDTACAATCHGKPWRPNLQEKIAHWGLGCFWVNRVQRSFEGLGGKKCARMEGAVGCVSIWKNTLVLMSGTTPSTRKTLSFTAAQRKKECQTTSSGLPTYSILATGMIKEPTTAEDGDCFFPTSPGAWSILPWV